MLILGIDPGYAIVGYGAVDYTYGRFSPVRFGAITTSAGMEFSARLEMIYQDMTALLDRTPVRALSIEKLFFTNNKTTAIEVAEARGVILLSARQHNVPVFEYTPMQVKQSVVGYGKAEKHQVMEMTRQLLGLSEVPRPDDTADALALAICHAHSANSLLTYLK
ncbi:MAG: crossover junction endodeoxyribonuclease RuvC [Anaerotruncus rubiinfantis]|jgi:crossover junction endodeoxyribonuclease RuvC|uniref:crossover junction endodeoxyribonuclease RuvC n=1 Tax=Anaerotruncus rubiinfantis TaxID=1720200 RepID=UPI001896DFEA|nr:crossover junction endodeoxyribonuclease RuvC [Anaerotruncus rubiinfantis]